MGKRLLSTDYQEIVVRSFVLPKSDWYNYYLNLIELNYNYNRDIVEKIEQFINQWIDLYKSKVYGGIVPLKNKQGEIEYFDINQIFEVDEKGNKTPIDIEKTNYPFQIKIDGLIQSISMNRDFFDEQLRNLDIIKSAISLKNNLINFENTLPESLKKHLIKEPIPEGFDYYDLKNRVELIIQIPDLLKEYKKTLQNIIEKSSQKEPRKYTIEQHSLAYIFDCNSIGESIPYGSKKELEKIGKNRNIGKYAPNTFYKAINKIFNESKDLNVEKNLVEIAGEYWKAVLFELTKHPEELKKYLQSKQL
ncbi:hypothetical protein [Mongoliitalea lutea]|uniref:Uncharacterized protein n=1 Tax=Mongoliitalea lutea TaxID=849756 RepID=A0A8J3G875_9BACT|nr:hypothetical protein [Mongoliitalea lutea]GHB53718.1 hypothetical protein GCM10008106_37610 [Mongoliitalea lutea]